MPLFQPVDHGTKYFFDFQASRLEHLMPLFQTGYLAGSLPAAAAAVLALGALWFWQGKPRRAIAIVLTMLLGTSVVMGVSYLVGRVQPDKAHLFLTADGLYPSFPSLPVFLASLTALFGFLSVATSTSRRLPCYAAFLLATLFVIWVLVSQLFLRVHFLSDTLAALCAACGLGLLGWYVGDALEAAS